MLIAPSGAPQAAEKPYSDTHHNITRTDPYAWLRDDNWQAVMKDPQALGQQIFAPIWRPKTAYTDKVMGPTQDLQQTAIFAEMRGRIQEDESSVPIKEGENCLGQRAIFKGGEHPLICCGPRHADIGRHARH